MALDIFLDISGRRSGGVRGVRPGQGVWSPPLLFWRLFRGQSHNNLGPDPVPVVINRKIPCVPISKNAA